MASAAAIATRWRSPPDSVSIRRWRRGLMPTWSITSSTRFRKRVEEVIDQVGINPLRHRRIDTLSGGERQRVAIAAALAMHPDALALDEPTSQLDPQAAEDVLQVVLRLVAELGMTKGIADHRVERIAPFVDRIWTLDGGVLRDQAPRVALAEGGARP